MLTKQWALPPGCRPGRLDAVLPSRKPGRSVKLWPWGLVGSWARGLVGWRTRGLGCDWGDCRLCDKSGQQSSRSREPVGPGAAAEG